jgi:hypothetical protein
MSYRTRIILIFGLGYGHFKILTFRIIKDYSVTLYNINIGKTKKSTLGSLVGTTSLPAKVNSEKNSVDIFLLQFFPG